MWNFLLRQLLQQGRRAPFKRAGKDLAGLFFADELNAPEAYADRIKRDLRLKDYADAWNLYSSDPAYWERYYNPPPSDPEWKDTFVRDSAAGAGIPSRRNVFEYGYPGSAAEQLLSEGMPRHMPDNADSFADRFGSWRSVPPGGVPAPSSGAPIAPSPGSPPATAPNNVRRLTRQDAPGPTDVFASGSLPLPGAFPQENGFNDRFGNWTNQSGSNQPSQHASRPLGVSEDEPMPSYSVPPPIWGLQDQREALRNGEDWLARWARPLLRQ